MVGTLHLAGLYIHPTHETHGSVEQQVALGLATADQQYGIFVGLVLPTEPAVVDIVEDIDIVQQDRCIVVEEVLGLLQSPTRL